MTDEAAVCPDGLYGAECDQPCPINCFDGTCSKEIGFCVSCLPGWQGVNCDSECVPGRYGKDCGEFCSLYCLSGTCNSVNGACDGGCAQGFKPPNCVDECDSGYHGFNCTQPCPINCDQGFCQSGNGFCFNCIPGYEGNECENDCSPKKYGVACSKTCSSNCLDVLCHHVTGICTDCPPGKKADYCEEECQDGEYGNRCNKDCSPHCKGKLSCDKELGSCPSGCEDGFVGHDCYDQCEPNTFGFNCTSECSPNCIHNIAKAQSACHHTNGACFLGCQSGYTGDACMKAIPGVGVGAVAGPVIAVLLIVVAIVIGIFIWKRSKHLKGNGLLTTAQHRDTSDVIGIRARTNPAIKVSNTEETKTNESKPSRSSVDATANHVRESYFKAVSGPSKSAIRKEDLRSFLSSHPRDFFVEQFHTVPMSTTASKSVGMRTENRFKNRYKNICAYDHTRVHLLSNSEKNRGDYINASHIQGYKGKQFIASQGPNKIMLDDFVRMLWEQNVETIVMLTNLVEEGKPKCEMYWPEDNETEFDDIRIRLATTQIHADYTIRTLHLMKIGHPTHTVTQFHFTSWPDKGVPKIPWGLVDFEQRVASYPSDEKTVVHCSAGVGRTGTFIALHHVIREVQDKEYFDFHFVLWKLRQERMFMIQTVDQYVFLHEAARVAILCRNTTVRSSDVGNRLQSLQSTSSDGQNLLEDEFKFICSVCAEAKDKGTVGSKANDPYHHGKMSANREKNRFSDILPKEYYRTYLSSDLKEQGDYINAVFVPSFSMKNQQILTQLPLSNTVTDFWRMVTLYHASLIIALDLDDTNEKEAIGQYLPGAGSVSTQLGPFQIETGPKTLGNDWEIKRVTVVVQKKKKTRRSLTAPKSNEHHITHLKCSTKTFTAESLLSFVQKAKELTPPGQGRTVYMCRNGADHSGLVCVLSLLLDRMDNDHHVTVPLVVGAIKSIRPQVIPNLDQYRMLYQALKLYYESNNVYFNYGYTQSSTSPQNNNSFDDDSVKAAVECLDEVNSQATTSATIDIRPSINMEFKHMRENNTKSNVYFKLYPNSTTDDENDTEKSDSFDIRNFPKCSDNNRNDFSSDNDCERNVHSNKCFQADSDENNEEVQTNAYKQKSKQDDSSRIDGNIYSNGSIFISNL